MDRTKKPVRFISIIIVVLLLFSSVTVFASSTVLKKGMQSQEVVELQEELKTLGYFTVNCTGYFGVLTETAVVSLQRDNGYVTDGQVGSATRQLISNLISTGNDVELLKYGMGGTEVGDLQNDLKVLGYFHEECTGYFGEITQAAVMEFQRDQGCLVDGVVGERTFTMIQTLLDSNANITLLQFGDSGDNVIALQEKLTQLGYFAENATGYYGIITTTAVKKLQKDYEYTESGALGQKTNELVNRLISQLDVTIVSVQAEETGLLKNGSTGTRVLELQENLTTLGYFTGICTGVFGTITENAVRKVQRRYQYVQDGVVGPQTESLINRLKADGSVAADYSSYNFKLPWFGNGENVFGLNYIATVYDIETGLSFNIKRTYGYNHADCETLTAYDTSIMLQIYGGEWSWDRRAIIVTVNGVPIAASMAGMPHAGRDDMPEDKWVSGRSCGYGTGTNLDAVKNNNMNGVFDIHLYQSRTHNTDSVEPRHQEKVQEATVWAQNYY